MELNEVIIKPHHTEKSYVIRKGLEKSTLTFEVNKHATKHQVRLAFKKIYNIDPEKINIVNRKSQRTKTGTAKPGRTKAFKLAYIILPKGIDIAITKDEIEAAAKAKHEAEKQAEKDAKKQKPVKAETKVEAKQIETAKTKTTKATAKKPAAQKTVTKKTTTKK